MPPSAASIRRPNTRSRIQRWMSTVTFLVGLGTTVWVLFGYAMMKAREARLQLAVERSRKERLRSQFSSTLSNISFTLYGLLPTLSDQLFAQLDVESLTEELTLLSQAAGGKDTAPSSMSASLSTTLTSESSQVNSPETEGKKRLVSFGESDMIAVPTVDANISRERGLGISGAATTATGDMESSISSLGEMTADDSSVTDGYQVTEVSPAPTNSGSSVPSGRWASEFYEQQGSSGNVVPPTEDEGLTASSFSQVISLPTASEVSSSHSSGDHESGSDAALSSPPYLHSPPMSASESPIGLRKQRDLHPTTSEKEKRSGSIPTHVDGRQSETETVSSGPIEPTTPEIPKTKPGRSKAKIWNEIKVKAVTRAVTSIYLIPLLLLQTSSQITLLSRLHYLRSLAAEQIVSLPQHEDLDSISPRSQKSSWIPTVKGMLKPWAYFSLSEMGLSDYAVESAPEGARAATGVFGLVSSTIQKAFETLDSNPDSSPISTEDKSKIPLEALVDGETEELFLCFSWWYLHVGWKKLESRVEKATKEVMKGMSVKQEMTMSDWHDLVFRIRKLVETEGEGVFNFSSLLLPPTSPAEFTAGLEEYGNPGDCPLSPPPCGEPLATLLNQTHAHFASSDAILVLSSGFDLMQEEFLRRINDELYNERFTHITTGSEGKQEGKAKRIAACLATVTRWSKSIWEATPGEAVERLTGLPENEAFSAVVFGDFGS